MATDTIGKVFANMYFPSQTQIHVEIQSDKSKIEGAKMKEKN